MSSLAQADPYLQMLRQQKSIIGIIAVLPCFYTLPRFLLLFTQALDSKRDDALI